MFPSNAQHSVSVLVIISMNCNWVSEMSPTLTNTIEINTPCTQIYISSITKIFTSKQKN